MRSRLQSISSTCGLTPLVALMFFFALSLLEPESSLGSDLTGSARFHPSLDLARLIAGTHCLLGFRTYTGLPYELFRIALATLRVCVDKQT